MILSIAEVDHIAELARLQLNPEEKELYREQLSAILEYVARLRDLDTAAVPPTWSVLNLNCQVRPDEPQQGLSSDVLLANAPNEEKGQFRVPLVWE